MIYLQTGILILEVFLCLLLNNLLKNKFNKKIRYAICIALLINCSNMRTYQAMWAVHTLFCLLVLLTLFKKRKPIICILLSAIISTSSLLALWICIPSIKPPTTSKQQKKSQTPNFYLLGKDFVYESTSKDDMEILFNQLGRLTKIAPVYFVYGNHENKIKFTRNKLNHKITKNNITILNDQEVQLNNITLIGRKDYTNKNQKKTKDYNLTNKTCNIVLDHQPQGTRENIKDNVDLQLSGHTHNGQMFPLSYSYHLQPDFAGNYEKKHSCTTQKSLAQALLVGVFQ